MFLHANTVTFIPDSVSTESLKNLADRPALPDWDGSFDTAFDIGTQIIDALPDGYYNNYGHMNALAFKAILNCAISYKQEMDDAFGNDEAIYNGARRLHEFYYNLSVAMREQLLK